MITNKKQKKMKKNLVPEKKSETASPAEKKTTVKQLFEARKRKNEEKLPSPHAKQLFEGRKRKNEEKLSSPHAKQLFEGRKRKNEETISSSLAKESKRVKEGEKKDYPRGAERQAQRQRKKEFKKQAKTEQQRLSQTLFVGNLPISVTRKSLEKMFAKFGIVESVRLRGAIPVKAHIPKKVADITRTFHEGLRSRKGYVVFKDAEGAEAALALNGTLIDDHHIIVDRASSAGEKKTYDNKRTVFLGNLPFDVDDEVVWNALSSFGEVEAVRVIRDQKTGAGKGFGYVLFKEAASHARALEKETLDVAGRQVRIKSVEANKQKQTKRKTSLGLSLKAKSHSVNPNSRKSAKKLLKREKVKHEKKKVADNFKKFF